jgi:N-ethylmaleimide reductase
MKLLEPYRLGPLSLPNRMVMAPLTRSRAPRCVPNEMLARYYAQRASAGLIVSEGTQVARLGQGYQDTPGIYSDEQRDEWRRVTDAVHGANGRIFAQLWHVGRVSHSSYHGQTPVAPSAIAPVGKAYTPKGMEPCETPRALTTDEVRELVEHFHHAATIAKDANFDGVELHAANGYLIDQFLQSGTNLRTDRYGGSLENRARFLFELVDAVQGVWGDGRVGVRVSPGGAMNGIHDANPEETFTFVARKLNEVPDLAYLHVVEEPVPSEGPDDHGMCASPMLRAVFDGTLISTGGYQPATAEHALQKGLADLIGFGRLFIANPDLPERIRSSAPLNEPDTKTFYSSGEHGYIDYPTLKPAHAGA